MHLWWSCVLLALIVAQVVRPAPTGKELSQKSKDETSTQKLGSKDKSSGKQMVQTGQAQKKIIGDNQFKFAYNGLSSGEQMKEMVSKPKLKSPRDHSIIQPASSQLHSQSDKSTEDKLMKMLNNEKNPKLVFPKSSGDRLIFGDHYDLLEDKGRVRKHEQVEHKNKHHDHVGNDKKYRRKHTDDEADSTKSAQRHFNVFKLKDANNRNPYHDVVPKEMDKEQKEHFHPRHRRPDRTDRDEEARIQKSHRHHKPEYRASFDRGERYTSPKRRNIDKEGVQERGYQMEVDREKLSDIDDHRGQDEFMGKKELFQKSYGPMEYSSQNHHRMNPNFRDINGRPFMGMGKSGFGYSRGVLGSEPSEDFSPDY